MTDDAKAPPQRVKPSNDVLGLRTQHARLRAKLTIRELANHLNMSTDAYRDVEKGARRLTAAELVKATKLTGVDLAWFFSVPENNEPSHSDVLDTTDASQHSANVVELRPRHNPPND
jgi:transcriptional regulator with XRE-family HTH domain